MNTDSPIPGILCLIILALCVGMLTRCADYPVGIAVRSDFGEVNFSRARGVQIIIEK